MLFVGRAFFATVPGLVRLNGSDLVSELKERVFCVDECVALLKWSSSDFIVFFLLFFFTFQRDNEGLLIRTRKITSNKNTSICATFGTS
jgi:hypothetical protein